MSLIRRRWTEHDLDHLRKMAGKYSSDQIAKILGRGRPSVISKAHENLAEEATVPATFRRSKTNERTGIYLKPLNCFSK